MTVIITHSDLKTFLACKRAWTWSEHDFRLPEVVYGPLALGTRVHAAIEHYYKTGGDPVAEHERLFRIDAEYVSGWQEDELFKDVIMGRACLHAFMTWLEEGHDDLYEVDAVEHTIEAPFLEGEVLLRGRIDVRFRRRDNGFVVINDMKTSGRWGAQVRASLERSWQHDFYLITQALADPDTHISDACYTVIRKSKHPTVERFRVPGSTSIRPHKILQLEQICREMLSIPEADEASAYPCPADHCNWCEYRKPCEIAGDSLPAALDMLNREYTAGGKRLRRYDPV